MLSRDYLLADIHKRIMRKFTKILFVFESILMTYVCIHLSSCSKKNTAEVVNKMPATEIKVQESDHTWFYFTQNGYGQIDLPQNVPLTPFKPWTEAVRISSANTTAYEDSNSDNSYAIVNRFGILCFKGQNFSIARDVTLFNDRTADNLVFLNDTPIFSVYKSSFFNDTITDPFYKTNDSLHLFLVQFDPITKVAYPILNSTNLTEEINSEVTDFSWDGVNWLCSIKTISDIKNSFSYVKWSPSVSLLLLSPTVAQNSITVTPISQNEFRASKEHADYRNAPERVRKLVAGFSNKKSFNIEVKSAGGISPRKYQNSLSNSSEKELNAKAIISQSWSAALFEDGTLFLEGALPGKHILRGGKPVAIRLPKLPAGFVYSDFVISDSTLYAAWEEINFYQIGRSGFLKVDLDKTLYSKIL